MSDEIRRLPIFPLANVVLFPRVRTPLHIFEPRYRQMTEAALAGERRIVMAVVKPDRVDDIAGDPPVFEIGCAGVIAGARKLPDGRFHIVLEGERRVRIIDEGDRPPGQLFRSAVVEALADPCPSEAAARCAAMRSRLRELVAEWVGDDEDGDALAALRDFDDESFLNALCNALPLSVVEKQNLIEVDGVPERYQRLIEILEFARAERMSRRVPKSDRLH